MQKKKKEKKKTVGEANKGRKRGEDGRKREG